MRIRPVPLSRQLISSIIFTSASYTYQTQAQERPIQKPVAKTETEQKVEISGKLYDARREDTVTKIVVTEEEIKQFGESNIAEVLKRQSGITVVGSEIRMRSLANEYTQILIDGEPLPRGMSIDTVNVNQIKRIEILRSATADMSTRSIAGTINIVMKKMETTSRDLMMSFNRSPTDSLRNINFIQSDKTEIFSYGVSVRILGGTFSAIKEKTLDVRLGENEFSTMQFARTHSNTSYPGLIIDPRFTWILDNKNTLTLKNNLFYQKIDRTEYADWKLFKEKNEAQDDRRALGAELNWEHQLGSAYGNESKLKVNFGFNHFTLGTTVSEQTVNPISPSLPAQQTRISEIHQDWKSSGSYVVSTAKTHIIKSGWDAAVNTTASDRFQSSDQKLSQTPGPNEISDVRILRAAVYVQDEWQTTATWSNYLGLRWEMFQTQGSGNHFVSFNKNTSVISPLFQSLWKLNESKEDQFRLAFSRSFKNPNSTDLIPTRFKSLNNQSAFPDRSGNPQLKPEIGLGLDFGYEHFGHNNVKYSASFYLKKIEDIIRRDISLINQRWVDLPINDDKAHAHGIEFDTKFPLSVLFENSKSLELRANAARNWSSVDRVPGPNNRFAQQARFSANTGIDYKANDHWSGGASYAFTSGGQFQLSPQSSRYISVSRRLDAFVKWKLSTASTVRFVVRNLLAQDNVSIQQYMSRNSESTQREFTPSFRQFGITLEMKL